LRAQLLFIALATILGQKAHAAETCWFLSVPCNSSPQQQTVSGGAYPTFGDMFNVNPGSIPTIPTSVGVEAISSTTGDANAKPLINVAVIKGFQRVGTALSTNSENTFYTYNLAQAYQNTAAQSPLERQVADASVMSTVNLGAALAIVANQLKRISIPTLGLNLRYNTAARSWDPGFGLSVNSKHFDLGFSQYSGKARTPQTSMTTKTTTATVGAKFEYLNLEYTYLSYKANDIGLATRSAVFHNPVHIFTGVLQMKEVYFTLGRRLAFNMDDRRVALTLLALQIQFSGKFAFSYMLNYVPGASSIGFQAFF
jgi:hypothetical protein